MVFLLQKYEKSSVMLADMSTKPCSVPTISWSDKFMTGFILHPTSDTEHYQLIRLYYLFRIKRTAGIV